MQHLTERDRAVIAAVIKAYLVRDIRRRRIAQTYDPAGLAVMAFELNEFANALLVDADGDDVGLAEQTIAALSSAAPAGFDFDCDEVEVPDELERLEYANAKDIAAKRETWQ